MYLPSTPVHARPIGARAMSSTSTATFWIAALSLRVTVPLNWACAASEASMPVTAAAPTATGCALAATCRLLYHSGAYWRAPPQLPAPAKRTR